MKEKFIEFFLWASLFLAPLYPVMLAIGFLLMADMVVGIYAAWKQREKITSRKMSNTISKIFLYNLTIIAGFVVEKYLLPGIPFVKITAGLIGLVEIKSLAENLYKATGLKLWDAVKQYLVRAKVEEPTKKEIPKSDGKTDL